MQYSPKLKKAIEQIKTILKENDISGFVVLHTPGFSEWLNHLETSYSCAKVCPEGVRLKIKESEVGREKAQQLASDTYNQIYHLTKHILKGAKYYMDVEDYLNKHYKVDFDDGGESSHQQQNN
jgi:hypothetical protein